MLLNKPGNQSSLVCDLSAFFVLFGNVRIKDKEFIICKGVSTNTRFMLLCIVGFHTLHIPCYSTCKRQEVIRFCYEQM